MTQVTVRAHNVSVTHPIKKYAEDKLSKLDTFFDNIQEIVVELDIHEAADENKRQVASAIVRASGTVLKASSTSKDMYAAIDGLIEKVGIQLKKHKEKVRNPKRGSADLLSERKAPSGKASRKTVKPSGPAEPIYISKPMDIEDAATILEDNNLRFLVYKDMKSHALHVMYPLENGDLGVLEIG